MACQLGREDALALYQDIYENIKERIDGVEPKVFNISTYIKKLYSDVLDEEDPANALQVVQAVPQLLDSLIANNRDVKSYFFKFSFRISLISIKMFTIFINLLATSLHVCVNASLMWIKTESAHA